VLHRGLDLDAGVVDEHVKPSMALERRFDKSLNVLCDRDVDTLVLDLRTVVRGFDVAGVDDLRSLARNRCAIAAPMPRLAPVTMATLPCSRPVALT
jgi:hypothetical protein